MWEQISERLAGAGDHVVLELLNEPSAVFNAEPERWNDLFAQTLEIVRADHPTRTVIVGPVDFNAVTALDSLVLPDDPHLLGTVHVYAPFEFTHQGAVFADPIPPVGATWNADNVGLAEVANNSSWDTTAASGPNGLSVRYDAQWAGFAVDLDDTFDPTTLTFTSSGQASVRAGCRDDDGLIEVVEMGLSEATATYEVDLSECLEQSTSIFLMNTEDPRTIVLSELELCTTDGCHNLLSSQRDRLVDHFAIAAEWSEQTGIPLNLGEFGAFGADGQSPIADRAAWTRTVRDIAEGHDISTSYWEFYSGFGAFDVESESWVPELRNALVG